MFDCINAYSVGNARHRGGGEGEVIPRDLLQSGAVFIVADQFSQGGGKGFRRRFANDMGASRGDLGDAAAPSRQKGASGRKGFKPGLAKRFFPD